MHEDFVLTHEYDRVILESVKHSLINEMRSSTAAIRRLCSAKILVNLISAFLVRISVEEFFVHVNDLIDTCVRLSFSSFWWVRAVQCRTRSLAPPWLHDTSLLQILQYKYDSPNFDWVIGSLYCFKFCWENQDALYLAIEKAWFLLLQWVAKSTKMNGKMFILIYLSKN